MSNINYVQVGELIYAIITIDGKQIKIPADKAREVHRQLDMLFGERKPAYYYPDTTPQWERPETGDPLQPPWIVTCTTR